MAFDLTLWRNGSYMNLKDSHQVSYRMLMYRDLIDHQPWQGKTKQELEEWLGEAENFPLPNGWGFNYMLGASLHRSRLVPAWLCFKFDDDGKAVEARMIER
ncbi:MAG: hypothetical protein JW709_03155 [Sedimentisphaerales bacterium]|nr:hypothetical protein [Sedimentisphaerales bacterium]